MQQAFPIAVRRAKHGHHNDDQHQFGHFVSTILVIIIAISINLVNLVTIEQSKVRIAKHSKAKHRIA